MRQQKLTFYSLLTDLLNRAGQKNVKLDLGKMRQWKLTIYLLSTDFLDRAVKKIYLGENETMDVDF